MTLAFTMRQEPEKQEAGHFGIRGNTAWPSEWRGVTQQGASRSVVALEKRGLAAAPTPNSAQTPPICAFRCFPSFLAGGGEARNGLARPLYHLDLLKKFWSGRRDSNPRPQPWQGARRACAGLSDSSLRYDKIR